MCKQFPNQDEYLTKIDRSKHESGSLHRDNAKKLQAKQSWTITLIIPGNPHYLSKKYGKPFLSNFIRGFTGMTECSVYLLHSHFHFPLLFYMKSTYRCTVRLLMDDCIDQIIQWLRFYPFRILISAIIHLIVGHCWFIHPTSEDSTFSPGGTTSTTEFKKRYGITPRISTADRTHNTRQSGLWTPCKIVFIPTRYAIHTHCCCQNLSWVHCFTHSNCTPTHIGCA